MECYLKSQIDGDLTTLHSNPRPLFGKDDYTVQNSPTTVSNLAFPFCTHPSTFNRKKCAVQVHLTEKGGCNFRPKRAPKCVAVRVLQKSCISNFLQNWSITFALIRFKRSTFLSWHNSKQNVLKITTLTIHIKKLCRVTRIRRFAKTRRSGVAKLKRWTPCTHTINLSHRTFWF